MYSDTVQGKVKECIVKHALSAAKWMKAQEIMPWGDILQVWLSEGPWNSG